jgi:hypothetical protein
MNTPQSKRSLLPPLESKIKDIYSKIKRLKHNFVRKKKFTLEKKMIGMNILKLSKESWMI